MGVYNFTALQISSKIKLKLNNSVNFAWLYLHACCHSLQRFEMLFTQRTYSYQQSIWQTLSKSISTRFIHAQLLAQFLDSSSLTRKYFKVQVKLYLYISLFTRWTNKEWHFSILSKTVIYTISNTLLALLIR